MISQSGTAAHDRSKVPLRPLAPTGAFGDRVHIDLLGPLPCGNMTGANYIAVMTDHYSKHLELAATKGSSRPQYLKHSTETGFVAKGRLES